MSTPSKPFEVLLVDDNVPDIELLKFLFGKCGIPIHFQCAFDGTEASDLIFGRQKYAERPLPDLILLDLNLPKKDGKEVLQEIKAAPELCKIPVIMLSSSSSQLEIAEAYCLGANAFISKPPDIAEFQTIINALADFWFRRVDLPSHPPHKSRR